MTAKQRLEATLWDIANALKAAKARGASVQAIAARGVNNKERYKSRAYLQKALEVDPNLYQAHSALAEIAIGDKNYDEAVKELDLVIGLAPRNFKAFERKIEVLKAAGKADAAAAVEKQLATLKAGA